MGVNTTTRNGQHYVTIGTTEIGYVYRAKGGWVLTATQFGNYAHLTGLRTKALAVAALVRTAK